MSPNPKFPRESYENFGGINEKASLYLTGDNECLSLLNLDFNKPGSLSSMPGSALFIGATVAGRISGLYEYTKLSGASHIIFTAGNIAYSNSGNTTIPFRIGINPDALFDFVTFVDTLFMSNGYQFLKYNDITATKFSCPAGTTLTTGLGVAAVGLSGTYQYSYGYLTTSGYLSGTGDAATLAVAGTQAILSGFTSPSDYGVTAIVIYRSSAGGADLFLYDYMTPTGATYVDSGSLSLQTFPEPDSVFFTLAPRYLDLYQNTFFMLGSTQYPSAYYWSEVGQPETILPDSNAEVRTNDGDRITGSKAYGNGIYIFKVNSFVKVVGSDSSNFQQLDVSAEYGSLSNRAVVIYNDIMLFLDKKGICRYNGATPEIISTKIESTFLEMNIDAAIDNAVGVHYKYRNQIWWGIPTNGSTVNNTIVIYDYLAESWTVREGFLPSSMAFLAGPYDRETIFYGGYSGTIHYVSASLCSDNLSGMTYAMQSKFYTMGGRSETMQYRRLFIDTDPIQGATIPLTINFRKDEQDAIVLTRQIYFDQFQTRIDFGIPAKSLSVELVTSGASYPIRINGFTLEARLQRKV